MKPSLVPGRVLGSLALAALLAGCASTTNQTPEQAVQRRASEYWQARISGDLQKAYALSMPSYRKLRTFQQFELEVGTASMVKNAEVNKVSCQADKCTANMKLAVNPSLPGLNLGTIAMHKDETWLLQDGQWWYFQQP